MVVAHWKNNRQGKTWQGSTYNIEPLEADTCIKSKSSKSFLKFDLQGPPEYLLVYIEGKRSSFT